MTSSSVFRYEDLTPRELRAKLLAFVSEFVVRAQRLDGVERIALLGSMLTPKANPKDVDVLVTIAAACDLAPLAVLSRRLQGRAQGLNRGADVFLASPAAEYLGRTCHWRECRPGLRASCDAAYCGARPHLHDDLGTIVLPTALVREPPVELYPVVVIRAVLPYDVTSWLQSFRAPGT